MPQFQQSIESAQPVAAVIISVALMLFAGFALTRITKLLRLPNVTAYILAGILIGPYCLNLVPQRIIDGTDFLSDIALAFIAFSTGEFFKLSVLKKSGMRVVWITLFEAVLASVFVFILTYFVLRLELAFSVVLAALASATAPASTMMTIRQTGAKGDFVDTLLQVVALDDVVGLVLYSVAISVALASLGGAGGFSFETLVKPVLLNLAALAAVRPVHEAADAGAPLDRQQAHYLRGASVRVLRRMCADRCFAAARVHGDGHGVYERRRK